MSRLRLLPSLLAAAVAGLTTLAVPAVAQDGGEPPNLAGIVVDTGGDEPIATCVAFDEDELTGTDLLERADLDTETVTLDFGTAVCSIEGTGCPADDCFCNADEFWNYSTLDDDEWTVSEVGASDRIVVYGEVDGWAWGATDAQPPATDFATVCAAELAAGPGGAATTEPAGPDGSTTDEPTQPPTTGPASSAQPTTDAASVEPTTAGETATGDVAADDDGSSGGLIVLGIVLLLILAGAVWAVRRRGNPPTDPPSGSAPPGSSGTPGGDTDGPFPPGSQRTPPG